MLSDLSGRVDKCVWMVKAWRKRYMIWERNGMRQRENKPCLDRWISESSNEGTREDLGSGKSKA